jgi:hypothetical protein
VAYALLRAEFALRVNAGLTWESNAHEKLSDIAHACMPPAPQENVFA